MASVGITSFGSAPATPPATALATAPATAPVTTPATAPATPPATVRLEDFLGEWRDSLGHQVRVKWSQQGSLAGELDVQLLRPRSNTRVRLNVKALGQGQFQCGHFELKLDTSSVEKMVWGDKRIKGKVSIWEREGSNGRTRSRSRSPIQRHQNCGCVFTRKVSLRCVDHQPLMAPRSVLHDISTPGAWAPPANVLPVLPEIVEKDSEVDRLFEAYDKSLTHAATAPESTHPQAPQSSPDELHEAKANLLAKHSQMPVADEAEVPHASPDKLQEAKAKLLVKHFKVQAGGEALEGAPKDPRIRRWLEKMVSPEVVAPTGGA